MSSSAQNTQPASRMAALGGVAVEAEGLHVAEVVKPPWLLGAIGSTSRARWCGICQATAGAAALAAAFGTGEHPVFHRAADRRAVAAELQQLVPLVVAQPITADQGDGTVASAVDDVAWKHLRHGQVWLWAARQAIAPAGHPSGVGAWRL